MLHGANWQPSHIQIVSDKDASREGIFDAIEWLDEQEDMDDVTVFYYVGHGSQDYNGNESLSVYDSKISDNEFEEYNKEFSTTSNLQSTLLSDIKSLEQRTESLIKEQNQLIEKKSLYEWKDKKSKLNQEHSDLLKEIEEKTFKNGNVNEELEKILKSINQVKKEIIELETKTKMLLGHGSPNEGRDEGQADVTGFISGIKSARVNVETLLDRGWNNLVSGKYSVAVKELLHAKQMDQRNVKIYNLLGWAYINMEQYDKANLAIQDALKSDENNEMAKANMAFLKYKNGDYAEAIKNLSIITENSGNKQATLYALFYLGLIYYEREMYNDAIELLNKAITQGPNLYEAYYYLGLAYNKRGLGNLATQIWKRLIDINQYNIWAKKAMEALDSS